MRLFSGMLMAAAAVAVASLATAMPMPFEGAAYAAEATAPPPMSTCERVPTNMHNIEAVYVGAACPPWMFVAYRHVPGSSGPSAVREKDHECDPKDSS